MRRDTHFMIPTKDLEIVFVYICVSFLGKKTTKIKDARTISHKLRDKVLNYQRNDMKSSSQRKTDEFFTFIRLLSIKHEKPYKIHFFNKPRIHALDHY